MDAWVIEVLKMVFGGSVLTLIFEMVKVYRGKNKENAEVYKTYKEGDELNIHIRTNIDRYVEEKTQIFKKQISDLEKTIIQISSKYRTDLEQYIARISDLEEKFDEQLKRNKMIENELSEESKERANCYELVKAMQKTLQTHENKKTT